MGKREGEERGKRICCVVWSGKQTRGWSLCREKKADLLWRMNPTQPRSQQQEDV